MRSLAPADGLQAYYSTNRTEEEWLASVEEKGDLTIGVIGGHNTYFPVCQAGREGFLLAIPGVNFGDISESARRFKCVSLS
ncbi:hypothetical protein KAX17_04770 [Candidatus Bipolaricaulota bacterium]|nr:hypothetical protein [Candidatus Bipolaricaulota bacterium]